MSQNNLSHIHRIASSMGIPIECEVNGVWLPESLVIAGRKTKFRIASSCEHLIPIIKEFFLKTTEIVTLNDYRYYIPKGSFKEGVYFSFYGNFQYCDGKNLYPYSYETQSFDINGEQKYVDVTELTMVFALDETELENLQYS